MSRKTASRQWLWIASCGVGCTLLLLVGFGLGIADIIYPASVPFANAPGVKTSPTTDTATHSEQEIRIAALGDSLTRGTGDGTGQGYVRRVLSTLEKSKEKPVTLLNNLAVNGLRADQLVERIEKDSAGYVLKQANVILLTIGGNDLFQGAQSEQMSAKEMQLDTLVAKVDAGIVHLKQVLTQLRKWNPDALIIYVGLYNPFSDLQAMREIGNAVVQKWNDSAYAFINKDKNMMMVPTYDLFQRNSSKYLSSDHFHPNGDGYDAIAKRIVQSIQ